MAAGDFTASTMATVILKQEEMFADPRSNRELQYPLESAKALLENQLVRFDKATVLKDRKCVQVKATFLKACRDNTEDLTDEENDLADCEFDGEQIESDAVTFEANKAWRERFVVWDDDCNDTYTFEDKMAYALAVGTLNLEKRISTDVLAFLHASAMANRYTGTYGTIAGTVTNFPANEWVPDLLAEMDITATFNEIKNPILLTGTNFRNAIYNAQYNFANLDQKDQKLKFDAWRWYSDPRTVDSTIGAKATIMFDAGAAAFWAKNEFTNLAPQTLAQDTIGFALPSRNLKYRDGNTMVDVMFDVYMKRDCKIVQVGPRKVRRYGTFVEIMSTYGIQLGPEDCDGGSGVLEFVQVPNA
jgi:hypothetical protein